MQRFLWVVFLLVLLASHSAFFHPECLWAQEANLENPQPGSYQSGISVISGWKCTAGTITVRFDGGDLVQVAYGTSRRDTELSCGDTNNGFGLLWNWNLLGDGQHTIEVFDDGVLFAAATFSVVTTAPEFLTGAEATVVVPNFPQPGQSIRLEWQEETQGFVMTRKFGVPDGEPGIAFTYVPPYGSFENLEGEVWDVDPADYRVAIYIKVRGGWWTKPYWSTPLTAIWDDGSWTCDITTGGVDEEATAIVAFLVLAGYDPPLMAGNATLPAALDQNAVAQVETTPRP